MKRSLAASAVLALALVPVLPTGAGGAPQKRTIKVEDNFFSPTKLTVNRGSTVTFRWPAASDSHDVKLERGPRGERRWSSPEIAGSEFAYRRKLTRPGRYSVVCTLHETEMRMTITVRRR